MYSLIIQNKDTTENFLEHYALFMDSLEKDEELIEVNNMVTLKLNTVNQGIIEYVKFILKYGLIVIKDFTVENNILKWRILDEN